jgi:hypothetical protein
MDTICNIEQNYVLNRNKQELIIEWLGNVKQMIFIIMNNVNSIM